MNEIKSDKRSIITSILTGGFPDAEIRISGDDDLNHIEVYISSRIFADKNLVDCHRLVLDLLNDMLKTGELHAVSIKTNVPK